MKFSAVVFVLTFLISSYISAEDVNDKEVSNDELTIADYTEDPDVEGWTELSDTVRLEGKSKAVLVPQNARQFKRVILFTLINSQPQGGAGFAGVLKEVQLDLSPYQNLTMRIRNQGQYNDYKIILRHRGELSDTVPSYSYFFKAPKDKFEDVSISLDDFKGYTRGLLIETEDAVLDRTNVTAIGIQAFGGLYKTDKQAGVASLEIDWIKAV